MKDPLLKHLNQSPPPVLFHYTSIGALEKITETGQIWASEARFLNDRTEYLHARLYIEELLRERIAGDNALANLVNEDLKTVDAQVDEHEVFIASFSTDGDSLPQWRGYCSDGHGVAVGFNPYALRAGRLEIEQDFRPRPDDDPVTDKTLVKSAYTAKDKEKLIGENLDSYLDIVRGKHPTLGTTRAGRILRNVVEMCSPLFKHASFKEEREWRLVINCYYDDVPQRHFRAWGSTVVPWSRSSKSM
jgi:hypothetical protein